MSMYLELKKGESLDAFHARLISLTALDCSKDKSLVKQEFLDETDVNKILARCIRSGTDIPGSEIQGVFADVAAVGDFATMRARILEGESAFMALSADVRREFGNDPARLIEFLKAESNWPRARELGLMKPLPVPVPEPAPVPVPPK